MSEVQSSPHHAEARKASYLKHKRHLDQCYKYLREVLPEQYSLEDPMKTSSQPDIVKDAYPNSLAGKWRIILRAKNYVEHLESVIEQIRANAIDPNVSSAETAESNISLQSNFMEKIRLGFLKEFTLNKPITEYSFHLNDSSDDESIPENVDDLTSTQNIGSSDFPRPRQFSDNTRPIDTNCNSVLFIPINVKPAVKGNPMYVSACAPTSKF